MKTFRYRVVVEPDDEVWHAYCPTLEAHGVATWGATCPEALDNLQVVLRLVLESLRAHGEPIPEEPVDPAAPPQIGVTLDD
jgi:predicted RNase H-like HicB family nuclease